MKKPLFTLPAKKVAKPRESVIEKYGNDRLKLYGYTHFKLKSANQRALPDQAYVGDKYDDRCTFIALSYGLFFCVEYKKEGETPTHNQNTWHNRLRAADIPVLVIDSKQQVDRYFPKPKKAS